jgi:hypothetical protein
MANRKPSPNRLLTVDDVYRQPVGPASEPKSLYALLLRFVKWRRERNWSETTLKTQTHHSYRFILWAAERGVNYASEVTRPVLETYQRYLYGYRKTNGEPLSTRTQRTTLQPLQVWFSWMTRQGLILANPAADLELSRLEKRLPRTAEPTQAGPAYRRNRRSGDGRYPHPGRHRRAEGADRPGGAGAGAGAVEEGRQTVPRVGRAAARL